MHPLLSRPSRLLLYLLLWVGIGLVLSAGLRIFQPRPWVDALAFAMPISVFYGFVCLSAWWVCRSQPLASGSGMRAVAIQIGGALQSSAVWVGAATLWEVFLSARLGLGLDRAGILRDVALLFVLGIPAYLVSAIAHYLFLAFQASHAAERRVLEAQVTARESELRALRAQLNPHFLFNSLNSINALVGSDPEGARRMCERLGDFLRRTLALAARSSVPLGEEVALVEQYLGIERVRFGSRLSSRVQVEDDVARCLVPPLVLQPLVENAVKHGVSNRVEGGEIRIEAAREGDLLRVRVTNPCDDEAPARPGAGVGLDNVRRRLHTIAPRHARLTAGRVEDEYRVELFLPATDAEPAPAGAGAAVVDGGGGT